MTFRNWPLFATLVALAISPVAGARQDAANPPPAAPAQPAEAEQAKPWTWHEMTIPLNGADIELRYAVVLPDDFDPVVSHPVLLAFAAEQQDQGLVEDALKRFWADEARNRGWIVVSPIGPTIPGVGEQVRFHTGAEVLAPALIDRIHRQFNVEGGRVHAAGFGRGSASAFQVATFFPDRFHSVTALSGRVRNETVLHETRRLKGKPITMYAGELDLTWKERIEQQSIHMARVGTPHEFIRVPDSAHFLETLPVSEIWDRLDKGRHGATPLSREQSAVSATLSELHSAAAAADGSRYFDLFAPDAVFMGTDASERWTLPQFEAYAAPHFSQGRGWTYLATKRHVGVAETGATAWFDERLENERYGECRGSGVLRKTGAGWKIVQYNLTVPIPNELLLDFAQTIRAADKTEISEWR